MNCSGECRLRRKDYEKLTDPNVLVDLMERFDLYATLPFEPTLRIDSTHIVPKDVGAQIAAHYSLPRRSQARTSVMSAD
jgi:hypothetical protein